MQTTFTVPVVVRETGEFRFKVLDFGQQEQKPTLMVSEHSEYLPRDDQPLHVIEILGGKLVHELHPDIDVMVAGPHGGFGIPSEQVEWLRASTQVVG